MKTPLTLLNGFLGAGKTTLLKRLLFMLQDKSLKLAVIVNDMSTLDVDGVIIANTELVSKEQLNFISISAMNISSQQGITQLDAAISKIQADINPDLILLETSGSSHPAPLLRYFHQHPTVALKGFLTLVDTVMLRDDYHCAKELIAGFKSNLARGRQGIEDLLVGQIMLSSQLLLTKTDRVHADVIHDIAQQLHPLNPYIDILAVQWGEIDPERLIALPDYNFDLVMTILTEIEDRQTLTLSGPEAKNNTFSLKTQVINESRPFHPQRLWDTCQNYLGRGIHRSKGFFWIASRDDLALLWNQAAGSINLELIAYWKISVLNDQHNKLFPEEREALTKQLAQHCQRFGDRCCRLTIIGEGDDVNEFTQALQACFCNDDEIADWLNGGTFDDPWPKKAVKLQKKNKKMA